MLTCPNCGTEGPEGFRYCPNCGGALGQPEPAREERVTAGIEAIERGEKGAR